MKSMALTGISEMGMIESAEPEIREDNDVIVRVSHMGVCGSDMHYYTTGHIGRNHVNFPFVLGHEGSGTVLEPGPAAKGLKPGQRIAIEPAMSCHECDQCRAGRPHTCRNMKFLGNPGQASGLLSEKISIPAESCFPVPEHVSNESAVLAEPLSIAIWAGDLAGIEKGMSVGILGCGPIGQSVLRYSRYRNATDFYVTDLLDYRLEMALEKGARWTGNPDRQDIVAGILGERRGGLDVVFDCCGKQEAMDEAIRVLKPGGKIVIVGIPEFDNWILPADLIRRKEITFQNVRRQNDRLGKAIELIANGEIDMDSLITHRFMLGDTARAFNLVAGYGDHVMKAIINIG